MVVVSTVGDVVARARRELQGVRRGAWNRLNGAVDDSQTTFTMARQLGPIKPGVHLGLGSEIVYVVDIDGLDVVVERGVEGVATAHDTLTKVEVGWRWFSADLLDLWGDEIRSWPDSLFSVGQVEASLGISQRSVDLPLTRFRFPLRLRYKRSSPRNEWADVPSRQFRVETDLPTAEFPSGNALIVASNPDTASYRLEYAQRFDTAALDDTSTDLADIGITEHLIDVSIHGVAWRALVSAEINRSERSSQPEPREAEEVAAGDAARTASVHLALRDARISDEVRRLRQTHRVRL